MSYCMSTDVQAMQGNRNLVFSDSPATVPSLTQVNNFITQIADEIDEEILRAGYQVPIANSTAYLTQINAMGAAWMVELALNVEGTAEAINMIKLREEAYLRMLDSLRTNPRIAGAIPAEGIQDNYVTSDGVKNWTNTNAPYSVNTKNW